jgi:tetratricopeptide (TPR) repeat protein
MAVGSLDPFEARMSYEETTRNPVLMELYDQFLADEDSASFIHRVNLRYNQATLVRLATHGHRYVRRAAFLSLGYLGDYSANAVMGTGLHDLDRGVRLLAENGIRSIWCRAGSEDERREISAIIALNTTKDHREALRRSEKMIRQIPWFAEGWNQNAIALYCLDRYDDSIESCRQALEINPYHFGAAAGMGQCYLKLSMQSLALESFRRALKLNPNLEGVRANVVYLEKMLEK